MKKIHKKILKWIKTPAKYVKPPQFFSSDKKSAHGLDTLLKINSLSCLKKNEISADEIVILMYWLRENRGEISIDGVIHTSHEFKSEGEKYDINVNVPLIATGDKDTFCFMVYEEDMPILFDPHDPIGLVTFHQNQGLAVYKGDFRVVEDPITYRYCYGTSNQVDLDAENDGCYRLEYTLTQLDG